ncbi:unnamed protein product [Sphagnum jensenii]|uniref:Uncharacterized protein n=1 Tax=Sphagnum jensenii TaxID=128206 RepID=A0ABP0V7P7_9BRYO
MNNRANQDALNQMQVGNNAQMSHYNANVDRLTKQYQMDVQANQNKPQSFGDFALNFGGKALGWGLNNWRVRILRNKKMVKSTIPVLDVYKATAKKDNPLLQAGKAQTENVAAGAKLAELGFDAASKTPSEHDVNASFLQTIRKDLGEKPKGWRALAAGITEGVEFGEKRKSILDSKERLEKYQGTLKKLEDVVALSGQRLATFQKGEEVKQSLTPYVSRTLDMILEGAPQERIDLAGVDLTDRYNGQTGENWKYEMSNGKGVAVVDRNTAANETRANASLKKATLAEQNMLPSAENEGNIPLAKLGGKGLTPIIGSLNAEMGLSKEIPQVLKMLQDAKHIIRDHPRIGSSWANLVGSNSVTRGLLGEKDREAYEKLEKITNRVAEAFIRAKGGNISDSERETIKNVSLMSLNSAGSKEYKHQSVEEELLKGYLRGQYAGRKISYPLVANPTRTRSPHSQGSLLRIEMHSSRKDPWEKPLDAEQHSPFWCGLRSHTERVRARLSSEDGCHCGSEGGIIVK